MTPDQLKLINRASEALEKLQDLLPVQEEEQTKQPSPEEVFMIVTCNGQREMTLERFNEAVRLLKVTN